MLDLKSALSDDYCYIKSVAVQGRIFYDIYSTYGEPIIMYENRDVAFSESRRNDMIPMSLH